MHIRMRMIAAGATVALFTGTAGVAAAATTPGAASASTNASSPAAKPVPPGKGKPGKPGKPGDKDAKLGKIAASLHVSLQKLEAALIDAKQTSGRLGVAPTDPAVVAVVSHDLGISSAKALTVIKEVFDGDTPPGKGKPGKPGGGHGVPDPQAVHVLAKILHISDARARQVLEQLDKIDQADNGVSPQDPKFKALAASLHLTPQQLMNALIQMKETLGGGSNPGPKPKPTPSSSPTKG